MPSRTTIAVVALVGCLLLAGCAGLGGDQASAPAGDGGSGGASDGGDGAELAYAGDDGGQESGGDSQGATDGQAATDDVERSLRDDRAIIKTGSVVLEVESYEETHSALAAEARQRGGYVAGSNTNLHREGNDTWRTGSLVVRIPAEEFDGMVEATGDSGTVVREQTETEDVTDQLVDLNARIENVEQRRDRLRDFYERAASTEDLLRIERELSEVQGEIERLEAKRRSLEDRVAYSTLRIEIREPAPDSPGIAKRAPYHERSLLGVFLSSLADVVVFARSLLVTAAGLLPWLVALGVPAAVVARDLRGRGHLTGLGSSEFGSSTHPSSADSDGDSPEESATDTESMVGSEDEDAEEGTDDHETEDGSPDGDAGNDE